MWIISLEHRWPVMAEGGCWMVTLVPALPFVFFCSDYFCKNSDVWNRRWDRGLSPKKLSCLFYPHLGYLSWRILKKRICQANNELQMLNKSVSSPNRFLHSCETFSVAISLHTRKGVRGKGPWRAMTLAQRSAKRAIHFTDLIWFCTDLMIFMFFSR